MSGVESVFGSHGDVADYDDGSGSSDDDDGDDSGGDDENSEDGSEDSEALDRGNGCSGDDSGGGGGGPQRGVAMPLRQDLDPKGSFRAQERCMQHMLVREDGMKTAQDGDLLNNVGLLKSDITSTTPTTTTANIRGSSSYNGGSYLDSQLGATGKTLYNSNGTTTATTLSSATFQTGSYDGRARIGDGGVPGGKGGGFLVPDPCTNVTRSQSSDNVTYRNALRRAQFQPKNQQQSHLPPTASFGTHHHYSSECQLRSVVATSAGVETFDGGFCGGGCGLLQASASSLSSPPVIAAASHGGLINCIPTGVSNSGGDGAVAGNGGPPTASGSFDNSVGMNGGGQAASGCLTHRPQQQQQQLQESSATAMQTGIDMCRCNEAQCGGGGGDGDGDELQTVQLSSLELNTSGGVAAGLLRFLRAATGEKEVRLSEWAREMPQEEQSYLSALLRARNS